MGRGEHQPERQCIGCGRRRPQAELLRLTVEGTAPRRVVLVHGSEHQGRGAYLCRRRACLDRAVQRKAFQRAFRAVNVVPDIEGMRAELAGESGETDEANEMAGGQWRRDGSMRSQKREG